MSTTPSPSPSRPHSRQSSIHSRHISQPSRLRQSFAASSDDSPNNTETAPKASAEEPTELRPSEESNTSTLISKAAGSARNKIVDGYFRFYGRSNCNNCESGECEHGMLSPRASSAHGSQDDTNKGRNAASFGGKFDSRGGDTIHSLLGDAVTDGLIGERRGRGENGDDDGIKKLSTTEWLAQKHGITNKRRMCVSQFVKWDSWSKAGTPCSSR